MAATINGSPASEPPPPWRAKPATAAPPRPENSQNAGLGRSPPRQHAEDRRRERQEADEDDGVRGSDVLERQRRQQRKADDHAQRDDAQGSEVAPRGPCLPQQGKEGCTEERRKSPRGPRSGNSGGKSATAARVAGREPLKITTPTRPLPHPFIVRSMSPRFPEDDLWPPGLA